MVLFKKQETPMAGNEPEGVDYAGFWNKYAEDWQPAAEDEHFIGDEWKGIHAGAALSLGEYNQLIEKSFIAPYITKDDSVIELGVGGGKTAGMLLNHCNKLTCIDVATSMLEATARRHKGEPIRCVQIDGLSLAPLPDASADVFFSYDALVHIEPRDIFNYLTQIPRLLRGKRRCIFHTSNMLSERGFQKFLLEYKDNLLGKRSGGAFSVMTDSLMEKFLTHLGYQIDKKDTTTVPRDAVWICTAPEQVVL